ncbi:MAG TPA: acyl carrier protein [Acidisarcina sp.]
MENAHIYRQLEEIFREVFDDDTIALTPQTTAADIEDWDSMAHIGLIVAIEQRMKIKFKTSELESLHNVGQLAGIIEYKLEAQPSRAATA